MKINIDLDLASNNRKLTNEKKLENNKINNQLNETLESTSTILKTSLQDNNQMDIKSIKNEKGIKEENKIMQAQSNNADKAVDTKNKSKIKMVLKSVYKIGEEFIDSMARKILKEKFKWNFSVYNDGKDAFKSIKEKDYKNFIKKGTDSILYTIKKIPSSTKRVIKNTKNKAIDEVFSWGKE